MIGRKAEFVDNSLFLVVIKDFWTGPWWEVNTVGNGFEFDFFSRKVVIISDASVELADAGAKLGDFDGDGTEADVAVVKFVGEPFFYGGGF